LKSAENFDVGGQQYSKTKFKADAQQMVPSESSICSRRETRLVVVCVIGLFFEFRLLHCEFVGRFVALEKSAL
jgi:hypothetical protein